jgi:hypothetical protein
MYRAPESDGIQKWIILAFFGMLALAVAFGPALADDCTSCPVVMTPPAHLTCQFVRDYVRKHGEAEARAKAAELHIPEWLIKKAESCK